MDSMDPIGPTIAKCVLTGLTILLIANPEHGFGNFVKSGYVVLFGLLNFFIFSFLSMYISQPIYYCGCLLYSDCDTGVTVMLLAWLCFIGYLHIWH